MTCGVEVPEAQLQVQGTPPRECLQLWTDPRLLNTMLWDLPLHGGRQGVGKTRTQSQLSMAKQGQFHEETVNSPSSAGTCRDPQTVNVEDDI